VGNFLTHTVFEATAFEVRAKANNNSPREQHRCYLF